MTIKPLKILISGGHLTTAVAAIQELRKHEVQLLFVGRKTTDDQNSKSKEKAQMDLLNTSFVPISAPKFHRKPLYKNIFELKKMYSSLKMSKQIVDTFKPDVFLSFGGYIATPLALASKLTRVPIVTHEQTTAIGRSNQIIAKLACTLAVSWPHLSLKNSNTILTGNPVRKEFFSKLKKPTWFNSKFKRPLIYITGGNQGAKSINSTVGHSLSDLTQHYSVIHQSGDNRNSQDFRWLSKIKKQLSESKKSRYHLQTWFSAGDVAWLMRHADLVIGRAGANTIAELITQNTKALLIPLPYSGRNEQYTNSKLINKLGLATILKEEDLEKLETAIFNALKTDPPKPSKTTSLRNLHRQAAKNLAKVVISCAEKNAKSG